MKNLKKKLWVCLFLFSGTVIAFFNSCQKESTTAIPVLSTNDLTVVTQTSAVSGGNITDKGGSEIIVRGVCWSTNETPTVDDYKTEEEANVEHFTSDIGGLEPYTTYYVRAYATNSNGTGYGQAVAFTTLEGFGDFATITTTEIAGIEETVAVSGGNITDRGGSDIIARGICWSTSENPTINDNRTEDGMGVGSFTTTLTNLVSGTIYYVRAYAVNSAGTSYGNTVSFETLALSASLNTGAITEIKLTTATSGGDITLSASTVTARGVCWNTSGSPTIDDSKTEDGIGTGSFASNIKGLAPSTTYYVRAYAINADGAVYGNEISFDTAPGFVDNRDGTVYPVVTIGNQVWMAENLKYLPSVNLPNEGSNSDPRYYVYGYSGNDVSAAIAEENYAIYGVLYNWPAAMAGEEAANATVKPSGVKGVCPDGWHLPNEAEWEELFLVVGTKTSRQNYSGGGALKESGTEHWDSPNTGANNGYGFTVLPAGHKDTNHVFVNLGVNGYFWNSSLDTTNPWYWMFRSAFSTIYASSVAISSGHSVRCLCN